MSLKLKSKYTKKQKTKKNLTNYMYTELKSQKL